MDTRVAVFMMPSPMRGGGVCNTQCSAFMRRMHQIGGRGCRVGDRWVSGWVVRVELTVFDITVRSC